MAVYYVIVKQTFFRIGDPGTIKLFLDYTDNNNVLYFSARQACQRYSNQKCFLQTQYLFGKSFKE